MGLKVTLTSSDWDERIGGWRCSTVGISGAALSAVYAGGEQADPRNFSVREETILWAGPRDKRPREIVAEIELTKNLPGLEQSKLELEKERFSLERDKQKWERRWKVLTIPGAALSAALAFFSGWALQHEKLKEEIALRAHSFVPPTTPQLTASLPAESSDMDFDLLKDVSVFDLRSWQRTPSDRKQERYSPTNYISYLHVRKKTTAQIYVAHYSTTGFGIDLRCVTHKHRVSEMRDPDHPGWRSYAVEADVNDEQVGSEFLIVTEATYWNGFQNPEEEEALTYTGRDITRLSELAVVVLFPEAKPFTSYRLLSQSERDGMFLPYTSEERLYPDANNLFIYWGIRNRAANTHYKIRWKW
jgi:hypothetical protein